MVGGARSRACSDMTCDCADPTPRFDTATGNTDCAGCGATIRRPRGRPPKPAADRRTVRPDVRFSPTEIAVVKAKAEAAGLPLAVYLRTRALS